MELPLFTLRIDGLEWNHVTYRYAFVDGFPGGSPEIILHDKVIGDIKLTDNFKIELREEPGGWRKVSLKELTKKISQFIKEDQQY